MVEFEADFARWCEAKHGIGFNSGTSALHIAMQILGVGPGDEVLTTLYIVIATSCAIACITPKPVYVEIDEATMNLDPAKLAAAFTPRTKIVMPVHLFNVEPILAACRERNLPLVEDAAQAHGARYRGQQVGTFGAMASYSFYPSKNISACGEGGALVINDHALAKHSCSLREHGTIAQRYQELLKDTPLRLPLEAPGCESVYHL